MPAEYLAVDYAELSVTMREWPKLFNGLSKNSEFKTLQNGLHIEYAEFDRDRSTGTPRTVSYAFRCDTPWGQFKLFFVVLTRREKFGCVSLSHRIEVTGSGCRLVGVAPILEYAQSLGFDIKSVSDLHICADFFVPAECKQSVLKSVIAIREAMAQSGRTFDHRGALETVEVGDYSSERNTYRFMRVYDKDRDSAVKGKEGLYYTPPNLSRVRFEVDLRYDKAKHISPVWLFDEEEIRDLYEYEVRYFLPPPGKKPVAWAKFNKNGANPAVPGTFRKPGTIRLSDKARVDWNQCRAFMRKLFARGASLKEFLPLAMHEYREYLAGTKDDRAAARETFRKRKKPRD